MLPSRSTSTPAEEPQVRPPGSFGTQLWSQRYGLGGTGACAYAVPTPTPMTAMPAAARARLARCRCVFMDPPWRGRFRPLARNATSPAAGWLRRGESPELEGAAVEGAALVFGAIIAASRHRRLAGSESRAEGRFMLTAAE